MSPHEYLEIQSKAVATLYMYKYIQVYVKAMEDKKPMRSIIKIQILVGYRGSLGDISLVFGSHLRLFYKIKNLLASESLFHFKNFLVKLTSSV